MYLNISQEITLNVIGKSEVHLSGYFEPNNSMDDQMFAGDMDDDDEGEEDELSDDDLEGL